MSFTEKDAAMAYASAWNRLDSSQFLELLAPDAHYASQWVLRELESKEEIIDYFTAKIEAVKSSQNAVRAELAVARLGGEDGRPCVILWQENDDNVAMVVVFQVRKNRIKRYDLCLANLFAPQRTGIYPVNWTPNDQETEDEEEEEYDRPWLREQRPPTPEEVRMVEQRLLKKFPTLTQETLDRWRKEEEEDNERKRQRDLRCDAEKKRLRTASREERAEALRLIRARRQKVVQDIETKLPKEELAQLQAQAQKYEQWGEEDCQELARLEEEYLAGTLDISDFQGDAHERSLYMEARFAAIRSDVSFDDADELWWL